MFLFHSFCYSSPLHFHELRFFITSIHTHIKIHNIMDIYIKYTPKHLSTYPKNTGSTLDFHKNQATPTCPKPLLFCARFVQRISSTYGCHQIYSWIQSHPSIYFMVHQNTQYTFNAQQPSNLSLIWSRSSIYYSFVYQDYESSIQSHHPISS
jgi:hypothetical protein